MRKLVLLALFLGLCSKAEAAPGNCTTAGTLQPFDDETITVSSTAVGLTVSKFAPAGGDVAALAVCRVETDSIRMRASGLNPTAAVGDLYYVTSTAPQSLTVCGELSLRRVKFIRVTTDASLFCTYYKVQN